MPPPSTLSSSLIPVSVLSFSSVLISFRLTGWLALVKPSFLTTDNPFTAVLPATGSSTNVFQALQAGHWPYHLDDSYPHSLQKKAVFLLFATFPSLQLK